jgi:hypothetical protein
MYWFRHPDLLSIAFYILLSLCWAIGGWLIVSHAFRLRSSERLIAGLSGGFLLFIALGNLQANFLPLSIAFWSAAVLILLGGLLLAWRSRRRFDLRGRGLWLDWRDLTCWGQILSLMLLTVVFASIQRGLAIFDEYQHLPMISIMAAGDLPPHFYLDPSVKFAYHYGLQVYGASLIRLGGLFPWSAWDLSKAIAIAFTFVLGWLWLRRITRSEKAAGWGTILLLLGGGMRWLLLFLPVPWLRTLDVALVNTGSDTATSLVEALGRPWASEGVGPLAFPFAFHNGIFVPVIFVLGSTGAMMFMTVLLLLLLGTPRKWAKNGIAHWGALISWGLIFTTLALSAEHLFAFLWIGIAFSLMLSHKPRRGLRRAPSNWQIWTILAASALLSLVQGAFITEVGRGLLARLQGVTAASNNSYAFSLRWPPALPSAHLGDLTLLDGDHLIVLLAELGLALFLAPLVTRYAWKRLRQGDWLVAGLGVAAWACLIFPLFFQYGVDRSITRLPATTLWLWVLLAFPMLWFAFQKAGKMPRLWSMVGYASLVFGGVVILSIQLTAIPNWQLTYFVQAVDSKMSANFWDRLPPKSQVFDPVAERAVTLFGRAAHAYQSIYIPEEDWMALRDDPDPHQMAQAGYTHIYLDETWWLRWTPEQRARLEQPCVDRLAEERWPGDKFRLLIDIHNCR